MGNEREALYYLHQSMREAQEIRADFIALDALVWIARLRAKHGEAEKAIELLALIVSHPKVDLETVRNVEKMLPGVAEGLSAEALAAAQARGRQLELADVVAAILHNEKL